MLEALLDLKGVWIDFLEIIPVWDCVSLSRRTVVSARRHVIRHHKICLLIREYLNAKTSFDSQLTARGGGGDRK